MTQFPVATDRVRIQTADFNPSAELEALQAGRRDIGAVVCFVGMVRDASDGEAVGGMTLEHYPGMTERSIESMIDAAIARFGIADARVVHRVGPLAPADRIVLTATAASHRGAAFEACEFLMDYLKTQAPFWKLEARPAGPRWVDARPVDDAALARWGVAAKNAG